MSDKQDEILQQLKDLNSIVTTITEHTIKIDNLTEWAKKYENVQIPKCDKRFDRLSGLLWGLLILVTVTALGIIGNITVKAIASMRGMGQ